MVVSVETALRNDAFIEDGDKLMFRHLAEWTNATLKFNIQCDLQCSWFRKKLHRLGESLEMRPDVVHIHMLYIEVNTCTSYLTRGP